VLGAGGARAPPLIAGSDLDRPRLPFLYVANIYFSCFKGMLRLFLMDVAKVDREMLYMLQVFQRHVASVCSKCFICSRGMFQAF
jgi:hypothetical protein